VDLIVGADGGNSKTELVVATDEGQPVAYVRGPGSNSHAVGAAGCIDVVESLLRQAAGGAVPLQGAFFLCGADVPGDIAELTDEVARRRLVERAIVDNDTFALLRAGTDSPDAVAVICGSGINSVGRAAGGRVVRYPSLGWETGDWGGGEALGREALYFAARAEDGRGEPTVLVDVIRSHFGLSLAEVGQAIHYKRLRAEHLGHLAPAVIAAAVDDPVAARLVERLADEVVLLVRRALRDLKLQGADVVLGGGLLREAPFVSEVVVRLARRAPSARPIVAVDPPVLGAALAALDAAGAPRGAHDRLRDAFRSGLAAEDVRDG
jgi:N-acetylglucosamine kinase-like BadF-type ATPase